MSKKIVYCAEGSYGIEFFSKDENEVKAWIYDEIIGIGNSDNPVPKDYYQILSMTEDELNNLPED